MKKYINVLLSVVVLGFGAVLTADAQSNRDFRPDYDYYGEEFDWRWDVRVRISDGINSGLITRWEANRLYRKLENIEEKEYAYAADGAYDSWEQDDVWRDVRWLNSRVGLELRDFDRTYYGLNRTGFAFAGYPSWWYNGGYNFYRFDSWGWGSTRRGYAAQCFVPRWVPNRVVYVNNYRNHGHNYYRNDGRRNRVVRYENNANNRNVTRNPRTNSGRSNGTIYNGNENNTRRGAAVTPNGSNRSSSANRSSSRSSAAVGNSSTTIPNRSTARIRSYSGRSESLNKTSGINTQSREANRPVTRRSSASTSRSSSREYSCSATPSRSVAPSRSGSRNRELSRPASSSRRTITPSRSSASRSESLNRSSRSRSARSSANKGYNRPSSSAKSRSAVSRSSAGRTKAPEARRSTSSKSRSSSSATRSSRREN